MKVQADRELCIQAGNCVMTAGDVFDQDDEAIVVVLAEHVSGEQADRVREAVGLCPANWL